MQTERRDLKKNKRKKKKMVTIITTSAYSRGQPFDLITFINKLNLYQQKKRNATKYVHK